MQIFKRLFTLAAHCNQITVAEGDEVKAGDVAAMMGRTGRATGTLLRV